MLARKYKRGAGLKVTSDRLKRPGKGDPDEPSGEARHLAKLANRGKPARRGEGARGVRDRRIHRSSDITSLNREPSLFMNIILLSFMADRYIVEGKKSTETVALSYYIDKLVIFTKVTI